MSKDTVLVQITCREIVEYNQLKEMSRSAWEKLKATSEYKMCDSDNSPLPGVLDMTDVYGSRGFDDVQMDVVDKEGKETGDYWDPE